MFVVFNLYINFDYLFILKIKFIKKLNIYIWFFYNFNFFNKMIDQN
jgi:hypothetical protein